MKKYLFKMNLALAACALFLISCIEDSSLPDNPIPPDEVNETLSEEYAPGEDFYMYCNAKWIDQQTVDLTAFDEDNQIYAYFPTEMTALLTEQIQSLHSPTLQKFERDLTADATVCAKNAELVELARQRIMACTSKEELWLTVGQMMKQGYPSPLELNVYNLHGHATVVFTSFADIPPEESARAQTLATRGSSAETWPMIAKVCEGLGIDADNAYVIADHEVALDDMGDAGYDEDLRNLQEASLNQSKAVFTKSLDELKRYCDAEKLGNENYRKQLVERVKTKYLSYELTNLYCEKYINPTAKQRIADLCEKLRAAFAKRMENSPWMSSVTKANALEKLKAMVFNIGEPEHWITEALPDISGKALVVEDILEMERASLALHLSMLGRTSAEIGMNSLFLLMPPLIINDNYNPNFNCINIFPPFVQFLVTADGSLSPEMFARFFIIGHEITHGFDTEGAKSNSLGDPVSIWGGEADLQEFNRRVGLLNDCFNSLEMFPGIMSDDTFCAPENIADLGGFEIALEAFKDYLTAQGYAGQRMDAELRKLYIGYAQFLRSKYTKEYAMKYYNSDMHSMPKERVNGIVQNTDDWYRIFNIKPGDKLYVSPEKRALIW